LVRDELAHARGRRDRRRWGRPAVGARRARDGDPAALAGPAAGPRRLGGGHGAVAAADDLDRARRRALDRRGLPRARASHVRDDARLRRAARPRSGGTRAGRRAGYRDSASQSFVTSRSTCGFLIPTARLNVTAAKALAP